jgi:hypothetical protein
MAQTATAPAQSDVLNALLTGGSPPQAQQQNSNLLQGLLSLLQPTPNPQTANAALGPSTTNVMNNAATLTGNPAMAAGNYDATQNSGINQQQAMQALQGLTQSMGGVSNQPNAYQKGVNKILQQAGQTHATQALQAGMNPLDIANHSAMQSGNSNQPSSSGQSQPQPVQSSVQLQPHPSQAQPFGQANQAMLPPKNPLTSEGFNPQTGQTQEGGFIERGLRGFAENGPAGLISGLLGPSIGTQMGVTRVGQVLKAGQPAEIAKPQAEAGYDTALSKQIQQTMSGNEPIQKKDIATIKGNMNQLSFDALNASSQRLQAEIDQKTKAKENLQSTINMFGHLSGLFSGSGQTIADGAKALDMEIQGAQTLKARVDSRISSFAAPNNPLDINNSNSFVEGGTYTDAQGRTAVYHGQGNK